MKTNTKIIVLLPALIVALNLLPADRMTAQTFTTQHGFTATSTNSSGVYTNSDGTTPYAGLVPNSSGDTLYGTARGGGSSGNGTVFAVHMDGTGFTNLYSFTARSPYNYPFPQTNSDGAGPNGLIVSGNTLYGTSGSGGISDNGTLFAVNTDGTGFTNLHSFTAAPAPGYTNSDGVRPNGLILSGTILYGTASAGGSSGNGTLFAVNTDGTGFTNLYSFTATTYAGGFPDSYYTNSDGASPNGLTLSGGTLYGTATQGGMGAVARCSPSTPMAQVLRTCTVLPWPSVHYIHYNSDGVWPNRIDFIGQHPVWDDWQWRQYRSGHGVRRQHRWHGFYEPAHL